MLYCPSRPRHPPCPDIASLDFEVTMRLITLGVMYATPDPWEIDQAHSYHLLTQCLSIPGRIVLSGVCSASNVSPLLTCICIYSIVRCRRQPIITPGLVLSVPVQQCPRILNGASAKKWKADNVVGHRNCAVFLTHFNHCIQPLHATPVTLV